MPWSPPSRVLSDRGLTYAGIGVTTPAAPEWQRPTWGMPFERTVRIGGGDTAWETAVDAVMRWEVKTRSGFQVVPEGVDLQPHEGSDYWLVAKIGWITVHEPARVVAVVECADRCGFAYGTLEGHPVSGEEAFIVHRDGDDVFLTLRSVTQPGSGAWRASFPVVLLAQRWFRRRYCRALVDS